VLDMRDVSHTQTHSVAARETRGHRLKMQLRGHCQEGGMAEERTLWGVALRAVIAACTHTRSYRGRDTERIAAALAVVASNDGCVDLQIVVELVALVRCRGAKHGRKVTSKNWRMAAAAALRTRSTDPMKLVRGRRCSYCRTYSSLPRGEEAPGYVQLSERVLLGAERVVLGAVADKLHSEQRQSYVCERVPCSRMRGAQVPAPRPAIAQACLSCNYTSCMQASR
jgi:hypothetical protein